MIPGSWAGRLAVARRVGPDVLGVAWIVAMAVALLGPALAHGSALGPVDWLSHFGLSRQPGAPLRDRQSYDLITEMIPWTALSWTQVHHGQLPLWNPYPVLGTPLAFNWQSSVFSLPSLLGYLAPLHLAYTVQVVTTVVVAGTGVYVLCRLLGAGSLGSAMGATVYELSGAFVAWLGWPMASVLSWGGWLLAAVVVVVRGRRRARAVVFLAVAVALAVYAGQPDALVLMATAVTLFALVLLVQRLPALGGGGSIVRPVVDLVAGTAAGVALGAPLLLPGAQLIAGSARGAKGGSQGLPLRDLMYLVFQGFDGSPVGNWFGSSFNMRTAAYVGVIGVVLAVVGVAASTGRGRRRPEVVAVTATALGAIALVVMPPIVLGSVQWHRALLVVDLALAVLAGVGLEALASGRDRGRLRAWAAGSLAAIGVVVALVFAFGRGHLAPARATLRAHSFWWPAAQTVLGLAVVGALVVADRRRGGGAAGARRAGRWAAIALVAGNAGFLAASGAPLIPSSPRYLAPTAAERALGATVGTALVGLGRSTCFTGAQLGTVPEVGDAFGLHEFAAYDPLLPNWYDASWVAQTGQNALARPAGSLVPFSAFCPAVTSVAEARRFGIAYVLEPRGAGAPPGFVAVRDVADETLFRAPGASRATLVPAPTPTGAPPLDAAGSPVPVRGVDSDSWHVATAAPVRSVLRLRLSDAAGWHATIDGRPLALERYAGVMIEAVVPAGRHVIELHYLPATFTAGLALAGAAVLALGAVPLAAHLRRRRRRPVSAARRGGVVLSAPSP